MSFQVFFSLSTGLSAPLFVPTGTKAAIMEHVARVEATLKLKPEKYRDNPAHWKSPRRYMDRLDGETFCETVEWHNQWVRRLYDNFSEWSKAPVKDGEELTPADAEKFWHALELLDVPPHKWTSDYYRARMESFYEVMRGRPSEGVSFDVKALTPKQAAAVVRLFEQFLDPGDLRLDVPKDCDHLASSQDGGYEYCDKCGPVADIGCNGCGSRKCPLREEED